MTIPNSINVNQVLSPTSNVTFNSVTLPSIPLAHDNGGTEAASLLINRLVVQATVGHFNTVFVNTGQLVIGKTGSVPLAAALTGSKNISVTSASGSITIAQYFSDIQSASTVTTGSNMVSNTIYFTNSASRLTMTLPGGTSVHVGDEICVVALGTGGFKIGQLAGHIIHMGNSVTTVGGTGSISSTARYDSITVRSLANAIWTVTASIGNLTVV